jgi:hypothetical protein
MERARISSPRGANGDQDWYSWTPPSQKADSPSYAIADTSSICSIQDQLVDTPNHHPCSAPLQGYALRAMPSSLPDTFDVFSFPPIP